MEILIVMTLVALGGSFVVGQLFARLEEGKIQSAKIQISAFKQQLEDYRRYCNQYPTTTQGLEALMQKPTAAPDCPSYPASGFIGNTSKLPKDPWDHDYNYEQLDNQKYRITSYGSDSKEGGEKGAADIKSDEL